jgi:hypothetical protein
MPATQKLTTDYTDFTDGEAIAGRLATGNNQCYPAIRG